MDNLKKSNKYIIALLVLMYLIVAMGDNFKGIFVPYFKQEFGVGNTQIGYVMMFSLFAYAVFQFVGGKLIGKLGYRKVIVLGFSIAAVSLAVLMFSSSFAMLLAGMFLLNVGMAFFNISVCTLGPALSVKSAVFLMNMIVFSYSIGTTTIQKVSGTLLSSGMPWRSFFGFMLVVILAVMVYLLIIKIPYEPVVEKETINKYKIFSDPMLYLYIFSLGAYLASEYGIGNWFVNYMNEVYGLDSAAAAVYVSIFFGAKTVGVLVGGFIVDRIGHYKSILIYGVIASLMAFAGIALGQKGLLLFALSGLFYSAISPTLIATISENFTSDTSYATGLIMMFGTLIAMIVSLLIGVLNDSIGTQYAFYLIAITLALSTIVSFAISKIKKTRTSAE